ncbi:MAG: autotransporter domain-containing protein, partial [Marinicellaceae bacterium]
NWNCSKSDLPTGIIDCFNTTSIDAGTSEEIIIEVLSQTAANYDNIANVDLDFSSSAIDADLNNNSDNAIVDIIAVGGSELFFAKDVVGGVDVGGVFDVTENVNFEYKLIIDNVSAGTSFNDLVVTDSVDVGFLSVQSVSSDLAGFNCSASGNDVTCTQDGSTPLLPGAQAVITIEVFPNAIGSNIDNVANISSVASAEDIDSNIVTINVIPVAGGLVDLDLLKDAQTVGGSTSVDQFLIGESFEYNIVVHNTGPDDAPIGNVRVVDALPPDIDLDAVPSSPDWDCSATVGTIVDCTNITAIPASTGFLSLIIPVSSQAEGVYVNSADVSLAVGSLLTDTDISNNNGTKSVTINPVQGNITLMKSVNGGSAQTRSVKKRGTNTNFAIGDSVSYTLLAQNTSAINSVTDLVVSDTLDTNFLAYDQFNILQSSANFTCNFDGTSQFSCTNAGGGPLNPGDSFEVEIIAIAAAPGINISNTAQASSVITGDNINSNTVFIDIDSGATPTTLTVQKQAFVNGVAVNSVTKGNAFNYRIDIQNTGPNDAQNLELIDNVPAGISVNSVSGTDWACSNVGQEYTCNLLNPLLSNSSTFVEFNVFDNTAANINQVQNVVDVTSDNALMVSAVNNLDLTQVSLDFNVSQNPDPVVENTVFELIVDIANTGSEALEGVQIVNTLPDGFSYVAQKFGNNCTINGQQMTCNVSNPIANGATETLILQINAITEANANASYINMTTLTGSNFPSQIAENTVLNVVQDGQLSYTVSIDDNIDPVPVGSSFMYDVSFTNNGDLPISTMVFEVVLPSELALTSSNPNNATCTTTNSGLACQSSGFLNLFPGETISLLTLDVNSPSFVGDVTASVSAIAENTLSASDTEVTTIASVQASIADLSVQKSADQKSITTGNQLSWNIDVTNLGPDSAQNVKITDQLPEGFEVISATLNGQDVCQDKGKNLMCNLGILNNQESATVTVLGTVLLESGVLENTVSVSSDTIDEEMKNNTDSASVMVNPVAMTNADIFLNISAEEAVIDKGVAQFNINVGNNGPDSAVSPSISMMASGNIENILLGASNDWNCQVNKSINITCSFVGTAMSESFETTFDVKLIPVEPMGSETTIVALTATISSETDDPDLSNNTGSAEVSTTGGPPTEQQILGALQEALAGIANQQTLKAIENVSSYCANSYENALNGLCDNLYNAALGDQGELVNEVMEQITPNEVIGQSTSVSEIASAQFRNVGSRLAELRGGGGSGFSTAGLNATYGNGSIPLGMLAYLNDASDESEGLSKPDPSFISPWGFFVNGTISMGERDATGRELGFDFDSYGLTAGVDYRLDARKVLGLALGYANFDSKIDDSAEIKSSGVTLTGYGSFYVNDNFYVDSRISLAKPDFDQSRNINFEIDDISVARTAVGKTDANQYSFAMSAGYHFNKNAWNITPNASVNYIKTNIDSFTETGAQEFNFFYSEQDIESLVWSAGMKVSKAISLSNGVITPQFDLDYNYESLNDGVNIEARFIMAPDDEIFIIETDTPDRTYGSAGLGLVYISSNGKQAYINYRSLFGLDGFDRGTFNIGARFEF